MNDLSNLDESYPNELETSFLSPQIDLQFVEGTPMALLYSMCTHNATFLTNLHLVLPYTTFIGSTNSYIITEPVCAITT